MQAFIEQEEKWLKDMVDKVAESGANVLLQKGINDLAQHYLSSRYFNNKGLNQIMKN